MSKKLQGVFLASILVNVLLVGVLLGELPRRFDRGTSRQQRMEQALQTLPEPVQTRVRARAETMREDGEPIREQIRQAREEAIRLLVTEPFVEAAYDQQVQQISALRLYLAQRMAQGIKTMAQDLPSEHRAVLADMLRRPAPSR